eukprot:GILK01010780.1.p1 GENE.GILK01010780.1~~GILK01010780.1.p1  ORF type:complete len:369 (-),score=33.10 GILK01010780.1:22-1128(-)
MELIVRIGGLSLVSPLSLPEIPLPHSTDKFKLCTSNAVLRDDGKVVTWSLLTDDLRPAIGRTGSSGVPSVIPNLSAVHTVVGASACFALTEEGKVYVWGSNEYGQAGIDSDESPIALATECSLGEDIKVVKICTTPTFTLFLTDEGHIWACGAVPMATSTSCWTRKPVPLETVYSTCGVVVNMACDQDDMRATVVNDKGELFWLDLGTPQVSVSGPFPLPVPVRELSELTCGTDFVLIRADSRLWLWRPLTAVTPLISEDVEAEIFIELTSDLFQHQNPSRVVACGRTAYCLTASRQLFTFGSAVRNRLGRQTDVSPTVEFPDPFEGVTPSCPLPGVVADLETNQPLLVDELICSNGSIIAYSLSDLN